MSKLISMMLIAAVGFAIVRTGVLSEKDKTQFSRLILYVLQPCQIVVAFQIDLTPERLQGFLAALVFSVAVHILYIAVATFLRKTGLLGVVDQLSLIYTNCGNLILPIVSMALGEEMVFYASAYILVYNVVFWTHGVSTIRGDRGAEWKKIVTNPNIIAIVIGVILLFTGIPVPDVLYTSLDMLGSMVGATCMLVIGMTLAGSSIQEVLGMRRAYLVAFLRLLVLPVMALLLLRVTGLLQNHPELVPVLRISLLAAAAPPASNVVQVAVLYNKEPVRASIYNLLGMMICVLTMPAVDYLYTVLF